MFGGASKMSPVVSVILRVVCGRSEDTDRVGCGVVAGVVVSVFCFGISLSSSDMIGRLVGRSCGSSMSSSGVDLRFLFALLLCIQVSRVPPAMLLCCMLHGEILSKQ